MSAHEEADVVLIVETHGTNQNLHETIELALNPLELATNNVYDLKIKIQDTVKAPACDQNLTYMGQPLDDASKTLRDLYLRNGDTLHMEYPEKADIDVIDIFLESFKRFEPLLPLLCTTDGKYILQPLQKEVERLVRGFDGIARVNRYFFDVFNPIMHNKELVRANRNYFMQEKGVERLMAVLAFTQRKYPPGPGSSDTRLKAEVALIGGMAMEFQLDLFYFEDVYNKVRKELATMVLGFLWHFLHFKPEIKLALQLDGLQLAMDAFLGSIEDVGQEHSFCCDASLGYLCALVELDRNAQLQVAKNEAVMNKLCDVIWNNVNYPEPAIDEAHPIGQSSMAAFILFYISFNQMALKVVISSGIYRKIINRIKGQAGKEITDPQLIFTQYYCLLFLARLRSATLLSIPPTHALAIDSCISSFLNLYSPMQLATLEKTCYIWRTLIPVVHLAFASGTPSDEACCPNMKWREGLKDKNDIKNKAGEEDPEEDEEKDDFDKAVEDIVKLNVRGEENETNQNDETEYVQEGPVLFPGSQMVQELGIFALQHTLDSETNRELLISENLDMYLLSLMWQLQGTRHHCFLKDLQVIRSQVPSLSLLCKGVLARMRGLDAVRNA